MRRMGIDEDEALYQDVLFLQLENDFCSQIATKGISADKIRAFRLMGANCGQVVGRELTHCV
ncbi:hypothetical protein D3C73_1389810 [compost metagenome]